MKTTFPNQKKVITHREKIKKGSTKPFIGIYLDSIKEASRNIKGEVAFKLYLYCAANQDGFAFDFSPSHFAAEYGTSLDAAHKAVQKLIEAGYLVHNQKNEYNFYELPQSKTTLVPTSNKRKTFRDADTGELLEFTFWELVQEIGDEDRAKTLWEAQE